MFEMLDRPLVWIPVKWPGLVAGTNDGIAVAVEHEVELLVELVDKTEARALFQMDSDAEVDEQAVAATLISQWRKIVAKGSPLPFSADNLARLVKMPGFMQGFTLAYLTAISGKVSVREKNSDGSPGNGRAEIGSTAATSSSEIAPGSE